MPVLHPLCVDGKDFGVVVPVKRHREHNFPPGLIFGQIWGFNIHCRIVCVFSVA